MSVTDRPESWPTTAVETLYTYSFAVWPEERHPRWTRSVYDLFRMMLTRVEKEFTERAFNDFREELAKCGLSLREIERHPYYPSQGVF